MGSLLQSCIYLFSVVLYQPLTNFPHGSALPKSHDFLSISFTIQLNGLNLLWRKKDTSMRPIDCVHNERGGAWHSFGTHPLPAMRLFDWRWIWKRLIEDAGCLSSAGRCVSIVLLASWSCASLFVGRLFSETRAGKSAMFWLCCVLRDIAAAALD